MSPADLKKLFERKLAAVRARPSFARVSGNAMVRVSDSLEADVDFGCSKMKVALPAGEGGTGAAHTPGELMRASVGSCLAMGFRFWGARLDIPVEDVEIAMHFEGDLRGQLGLDDDVLPGWNRMTYTIRITSSAPEADLQRLVETVERTSAMLGNLRPDIARERTLEIVRPAAAKSAL